MVKVGDVVRVRVTEVDVPRKRIGLTMRTDADAAKPAARAPAAPAPRTAGPAAKTGSQGGFGAALAEAMRRK